jgi:hypothetical protein
MPLSASNPRSRYHHAFEIEEILGQCSTPPAHDALGSAPPRAALNSFTVSFVERPDLQHPFSGT